MKASALMVERATIPAKKREPVISYSVVPAFSPIVSPQPGLLQRKPGCACGGDCPRCAGELHDANVQTKLTVSTPGDHYEREADHIAEQVMRMPEGSQSQGLGFTPHPRIQRKCSECTEKEELLLKHEPFSQSSLTGQVSDVSSVVHEALRSPGSSLDRTTRADMERRFGHDFSQVRVHTNEKAAIGAAQIGARAFTTGHDIVFSKNQFAPDTATGRLLLAHELAHVVQQTAAPTRGNVLRTPEGLVQRAPIGILDENFIGPPSATQRRAEKSCNVSCCLRSLGTLHAMPLFHHESRGARVAAGSASATGIGAALHFIAESTQPRAGDRCHCDDFRIIQVLETNDPAAGRGGNSYVDNSGRNTPFYSDVFLGGRGEHAIPAGYPDAGGRVATTESIYDRPFRDPATLAARNLNWMAESCVSCIKNTEPDRVLGCVTYGFTRTYNAVSHTFDPVVAVSPSCLSRPTAHFVSTLRSDPTTATYDFQPSPDLDECMIGDFPTPSEDTRIA